MAELTEKNILELGNACVEAGIVTKQRLLSLVELEARVNKYCGCDHDLWPAPMSSAQNSLD